MSKNLLLGIIGVLFIACLVEGYWVVKERNEKIALGATLVKVQMSMAKQQTAKPKLSFVMKGQKFADNPLFQKAYLIAPVPGQLPDDAQKALTGWTVTNKTNADGTIQVTLTPKDTDDVEQTFTLKTGYKLYFIEMTLGDEKTGTDANRGDDTGVLVDDKGIVQ